jgi:hypothetical protein
LGPELGDAERALVAASVIAPFAGKLLAQAARGAEAFARVAAKTGQTAEELARVLRVAQEVEKNRVVLREALDAERAGRALTVEQRTALDDLRSRFADIGLPPTGTDAVLEGKAIRPQDAKNAKDISGYIGKPASPNSPPPGYVIQRQPGQRMTIRRGIADDAVCAPLTIDGQGRIQWGSSERISRPGALAQALGPGPARHQAHHLVTDSVVRDSPLFQAARERGAPPYKVDTKSNGMWLPDSPDARTPATQKLPGHCGSHAEYSRLAMIEVDSETKQIEAQFGSLDKAPATELTAACHRVEDQMRARVLLWTEKNGDKLR